jgi:hypothetical protein
MNIRGMNAWNTTRIVTSVLPVAQRLKGPAVRAAGLLQMNVLFAAHSAADNPSILQQ